MNQAIEKKIEQVLALQDLNAQDLSRMLWGFGGLFNELAAVVGDREAVARSSLFRRALERLSELEEAELAARRAARQPASQHRVNGPSDAVQNAGAKPASELAGQ